MLWKKAYQVCTRGNRSVTEDPVINRVLSVTASSLASSSPLFFLLLNKFPLPLVFLCLLSSSLPFLQDLPSFFTTRCSRNPPCCVSTRVLLLMLSLHKTYFCRAECFCKSDSRNRGLSQQSVHIAMHLRNLWLHSNKSLSKDFTR